jgi:hypothetical protein
LNKHQSKIVFESIITVVAVFAASAIAIYLENIYPENRFPEEV